MRVLLKVLLSAVAVHLIAGIPAASAQTAARNKCDDEMQMQALDQDEPRNWTDLYRLFKDFGSCDGGALGDRFSADVGQLFAEQWTHLDALNRLAANKGFERFVLRHIDTTIDENDLLVIAYYSKTRCPAAEKRLCGLIHTKAQATLDSLREESE